MNSRRKHVMQGLRDEVEALQEGQEVARVVGARGGNIMEVELANGRRTLCMMPARFHKKLWVRTGGFVVLEESGSAAARDDKVTGTILQVLYEDHIKQLRKVPGAWPPEFDAVISSSSKEEGAAAAQGSGLELDQGDRDQGANAMADGAEGGKGAAPIAGVPDNVGNVAAALAVVSLEGSLPGPRAEGEQAEGASSSSGSGQAGNGASTAGDSKQQQAQQQQEEEEEEEDEDDDLPPLFQNNNRRIIYHEVSDSDEES